MAKIRSNTPLDIKINGTTVLTADSTGIYVSGSITANSIATTTNGSFATTGSNSFNGNQTITGSAVVTSNLSVGTTSTTSPLTIISSASPLITIQSTNATSYSNMRFSGTGRLYTIGVGNASETSFGVANEFFIYDDTAGAMRMVVDSTGKIGIGTTSPSSLLHVNGAVNATSFTGDGSGLTNVISTLRGQIISIAQANYTII